MKKLLAELRQRNVFRVAGVYAIAAWFIMQLVDVLMSALELPDWVDGFVLLLLIAGFLIALVFAWLFELGPGGIVRSDPASLAAAEGPGRTDWAIIVALAAVFGISIFQVMRGTPPGDVSAASVAPAAGAEAPAQAAAASIAVLPFTNLSSDPDQEYFSDGLAEELMMKLARVGGSRRSPAWSTIPPRHARCFSARSKTAPTRTRPV